MTAETALTIAALTPAAIAIAAVIAAGLTGGTC